LLDAQVEVGHQEPLCGGEVGGAAGVGSEAVPGSDEVGVGVVFGLLGVEQVADQAGRVLVSFPLLILAITGLPFW
jgi:hypothetical protein